MDEQSSPLPDKKTGKPIMFSFPDAMRQVLEGKRITRLDWHDEQTFGILKDGYLMIFINGKFNQWIVNDGDMEAMDWVVLPDSN